MFLIYIILIFNIFLLVVNINFYVKIKTVYAAIKNRKVITIGYKQQLDMNNDFDFVKYLIIREYMKYGENIYTNEALSKKSAIFANILLKNDIGKYDTFLANEKKCILNNLKSTKNNIILKIFVNLIIMIAALFCIISLIM